MQIKEKTLLGKKSFLVDRHLSRKRAIKMLAGPLARRWCKTTWDLLYTGRYAKRKPGLNEGQDCCPCIAPQFHYFFMDNLGYISCFGTCSCGSGTDAWLPHIVFSPFSGWIPIWSVEAHHVYLFALASKTHVRGAPFTIQAGAGGLRRWCKPLSRSFIGSLRKPSYSASFLH